MRRYEDVVENQQGTPVAGVSVQVNLAGTSTPAQLFSDDGVTALVNPVKTDSLGRFSFYIATGKYDLIASGGGISIIYTQQNVSIDELTDPSPLDTQWSTEQILFVPQTTSPLTPPGGSVVYSKAFDNNLYYKNAAGQEVGPLGNTGVTDINGSTGSIQLVAEMNITISQVGNVFTFSAAGGGGGGGGVTHLNGLLGDISLIQGANMSIAQVGNNLLLSASATTSNLYVDVTQFGAKTVFPFNPPNALATCTANSTTITLTNISQGYTNGEGVAFYGCGPACTLGTPGAPTVTPSYSASLTGVGDVVSAPSGSTISNYQVIARQQNGALTAAGPVGTTSTANPLGLITTNVSTLSRSGNVVTVTLAASQLMVVGQSIWVQNSSDVTFSGVYVVNSVINSFSFTYLQGLTTTNGASTSATGGIVESYSCNFVTWAAVPGAWQYYIYGCSGVGCTPSIVGVVQPGFTSFEDYGPAYNEGAPTRPLFVPAAPPVASVAGTLSTTIISGGGTTTLTVANPASTSTSGSYCQHDDAPCILAAANFVASINGRNTLHFPVSSGPGGNHVNCAFLISSFLSIPFNVQGVVQSMPIWAADTMQLPDKLTWQGDIGGGFSAAPSFAWNTSIPIISAGANPMIYQGTITGANRWDNVNFQTNGAGVVIYMNGGFNWTFTSCAFQQNDSSDKMGIFMFGVGVSQIHIENTSLLAPDPLPYGYSLTPSLFMQKGLNGTDSTGGLYCDRMFLVGRGVFMKSPGIGAFQPCTFRDCYTQALRTPFFGSGAMNNAQILIHTLTDDTSSAPFVTNFQPTLFLAPNITLQGGLEISAEAGSGQFAQMLSGLPANSVYVENVLSITGTGGTVAPVGQNFNVIIMGGSASGTSIAGGDAIISGNMSVGTLKTPTLVLSAVPFASLGAPANGSFVYCPDCTVSAVCAGAGTGALAKRLNGQWVCN